MEPEKSPLFSDSAKRSILKNARQAKGLTLENVHESTKIPMDVLRAIEEGYSVRSVTPFYFKGFVKMYASFLEVNPSEVMEVMPLQKNNIRKVSDIEKETVDFWSSVDNFMTRKRKQQLAVTIGVVLALFVAVKLFGFIKSKWPTGKKNTTVKEKSESSKAAQEKKIDKPVKKKEVVKAIEPEVKQEVKAKENLATEKAAAVEKSPPTKSSATKESAKVASTKETSSNLSKNVILTTRAKKDSWLLVKADDQVVFQSTLSTGSVETWLAEGKIEISGRNLNQLEFELNGKMIGPLGRQDRLAKRIIFTREGLSVTK